MSQVDALSIVVTNDEDITYSKGQLPYLHFVYFVRISRDSMPKTCAP